MLLSFVCVEEERDGLKPRHRLTANRWACLRTRARPPFERQSVLCTPRSSDEAKAMSTYACRGRAHEQAPGIAAADVAGGNDQKPPLSTGGDQMER